MKKPFVRSPYNYDRNSASLATAIDFDSNKERVTQQQFKDECDINTIVRRFGLLPIAEKATMWSESDFTDVTDYQTAMNVIRDADEAFNKLPSKLRTRFNNDPQKFFEFCMDNNNYEEARAMGLVPPAPIVKAPPVPGDVPPPEPAPAG